MANPITWNPLTPNFQGSNQSMANASNAFSQSGNIFSRISEGLQQAKEHDDALAQRQLENKKIEDLKTSQDTAYGAFNQNLAPYTDTKTGLIDEAGIIKALNVEGADEPTKTSLIQHIQEKNRETKKLGMQQQQLNMASNARNAPTDAALRQQLVGGILQSFQPTGTTATANRNELDEYARKSGVALRPDENTYTRQSDQESKDYDRFAAKQYTGYDDFIAKRKIDDPDHRKIILEAGAYGEMLGIPSEDMINYGINTMFPTGSADPKFWNDWQDDDISSMLNADGSINDKNTVIINLRRSGVTPKGFDLTTQSGVNEFNALKKRESKINSLVNKSQLNDANPNNSNNTSNSSSNFDNMHSSDE